MQRAQKRTRHYTCETIFTSDIISPSFSGTASQQHCHPIDQYSQEHAVCIAAHVVPQETRAEDEAAAASRADRIESGRVD
jgi:hypothetical protein